MTEIFDHHNIVDLREKKRMSIAEMARLFRVSRRTIEKWEKGETKPPASALILYKFLTTKKISTDDIREAL